MSIDIRVERIVPQIQPPPAPDWSPDPELASWTDEEVAAEYARLLREHERRQVIRRAAEASEEARVTYRAAVGIHDGMVWRQPSNYLEAVQPGETRVWEGTLYANTSGAPALQSPGDAPELWTPASPVGDGGDEAR